MVIGVYARVRKQFSEAFASIFSNTYTRVQGVESVFVFRIRMDFEVVERSISNFSFVIDHAELSSSIFRYIQCIFRRFDERINFAAICFRNG